MEQHAHPPQGVQATIQAAVLLIQALDAEQALAKALEPMYPALRDAGHEDAATELSRVQHELRAALVVAGNLVNDGLGQVAAGMPSPPEA